MQLLEGRYRARVTPVLDIRHFELAIAAVLLHDTGYLKLRSDREGTGAKYTLVHVIRSCAFAASYLPTIGFTGDETELIMNAIRCTGPRSSISQLHFSGDVERFIGCALATADFLGQMAAPDYVDELAFLYAEFEESDDFFNTPRDQRLYRSVRDLIAKGGVALRGPPNLVLLRKTASGNDDITHEAAWSPRRRSHLSVKEVRIFIYNRVYSSSSH